MSSSFDKGLVNAENLVAPLRRKFTPSKCVLGTALFYMRNYWGKLVRYPLVHLFQRQAGTNRNTLIGEKMNEEKQQVSHELPTDEQIAAAGKKLNQIPTQLFTPKQFFRFSRKARIKRRTTRELAYTINLPAQFILPRHPLRQNHETRWAAR